MLSIVSPLQNSRKRNRIQEENHDSSNLGEMELDSEDKRRPVGELNSDELKIAQTIAQEAIKSSLFISVEIPAQKRQQFLGSDSPMDLAAPLNADPIQDETTSIEPMVYTLSKQSRLSYLVRIRTLRPKKDFDSLKGYRQSNEIQQKTSKEVCIILQ